jgi:hypothetical protein
MFAIPPSRVTVLLVVLTVSPPCWAEGAATPVPDRTHKVRVAAVQAKRNTIDFRLKPTEVLAAVDKNLGELEASPRGKGRLDQLHRKTDPEPKGHAVSSADHTLTATPFAADQQFAPSIAARYAGDAGIEHDPHVVFVENFEDESLDALAMRWETVGHREIMSLSDDRPPVSGGKQSLMMDRREGSGGQLYRRLKNPAGGWGFDRLFVRFYVKFAADSGELHHGVSAVGGNNPPTPWPAVSAGRTARRRFGRASNHSALRGPGITTLTGARCAAAHRAARRGATRSSATRT